MKKWLPLILFLNIVIGCNTIREGQVSETKRILKVGMMFEDPKMINLFEKKYPDIQVEVITLSMSKNDMTSKDSVEKKEIVDLLIAGEMSRYYDLIKENALLSLESLMKTNDFYIENYADNIVSSLKTLGSGKIYGIPISYTAPYLIYNKKMFEEKAVSIPTDRMAWTEVFNLAKQMKQTTGTQKRYGLYDGMSQRGGLLGGYLFGLKLKKFDPKTLEMTINEPQWESALEIYVKQVKEKTVQSIDLDPHFREGKHYNFKDKRSYASQTLDIRPMTVCRGLTLFSELLTDLSDSTIPSKEKDDWDIVSYPVHTKGKNTLYVGIRDILCIPQNSTNVEDAWKFIAFMADPKTDAARTIRYQKMPVTKEGIERWKKNTGKNIDSFYAYQLPLMYNPEYPMGSIDDAIFYSSKFEKIMSTVFSGKKSVKELLAEFMH